MTRALGLLGVFGFGRLAVDFAGHRAGELDVWLAVGTFGFLVIGFLVQAASGKAFLR